MNEIHQLRLFPIILENRHIILTALYHLRKVVHDLTHESVGENLALKVFGEEFHGDFDPLVEDPELKEFFFEEGV